MSVSRLLTLTVGFLLLLAGAALAQQPKVYAPGTYKIDNRTVACGRAVTVESTELPDYAAALRGSSS